MKKFNGLAALVTLGFVGINASAVFASTYQIDLSGNDSTNFNNLPSSFGDSVGGVDWVADGKYFNGSVSYSNSTNNIVSHGDIMNAKIGRFRGGAGVSNSRSDNHTVDGYNVYNDFIQLSFSSEVSLSELSFGFGGSSFRFIVDTNNDGALGVGDFFSDSLATGASVSPGNSTFSKLFGIAAFGRNDGWKLETVTFNTPDVSTVPLPAGGLLLLSGLAGLGFARRRKAK